MLHADNETNKRNEDNMLGNSFMTCRLRETVSPPGMKIDLSKGTKDGTRERGNERIQNVICQSECSSKRLCCGQSCLVLFHLLLADRCPKLSQIRTLKLKKPVASPHMPDSLQDSKNLCNDCGM